MEEKKYKEPEHEFLNRMQSVAESTFAFGPVTHTDIERLLGLIAKYEPYHHAYYK
jgi:hypothetical protein